MSFFTFISSCFVIPTHFFLFKMLTAWACLAVFFSSKLFYRFGTATAESTPCYRAENVCVDHSVGILDWWALDKGETQVLRSDWMTKPDENYSQVWYHITVFLFKNKTNQIYIAVKPLSQTKLILTFVIRTTWAFSF